jgi:HTH-type transcriptional regulator / antitoxin HigA
VLAIVEDLMAKGERNLTAEENALLDLLVDLVHDFEERHEPFPSSPPCRMVAFLLEQRGTGAERPLPGSWNDWVSEVLSGKRGSARSRPRNSPHFSTWASNCSSDANRFAAIE